MPRRPEPLEWMRRSPRHIRRWSGQSNFPLRGMPFFLHHAHGFICCPPPHRLPFPVTGVVSVSVAFPDPRQMAQTIKINPAVAVLKYAVFCFVLSSFKLLFCPAALTVACFPGQPLSLTTDIWKQKKPQVPHWASLRGLNTKRVFLLTPRNFSPCRLPLKPIEAELWCQGNAICTTRISSMSRPASGPFLTHCRRDHFISIRSKPLAVRR